MRRINIKPMIQRERRRIIIQRRIRTRIMHGDRRVRQARDEFLDPAYTLYARDGRAVGRVVPEIDVHAVVEAFPFFLCE